MVFAFLLALPHLKSCYHPSHQFGCYCVRFGTNRRCVFCSLLEFFKKMKKWLDMANLPPDFRDKIERLERNFAVSTVIYKKFEPIFLSIFNQPSAQPKQQRSRKQRFDFISCTCYMVLIRSLYWKRDRADLLLWLVLRCRRLPCTTSEVFSFCWTMFVHVKG